MEYIFILLFYGLPMAVAWYFSGPWQGSPAQQAMWRKLDCMAFRYWVRHPEKPIAIDVVTYVETITDRVTGRVM